MDSSRRALSSLQRELLEAFFALDPRGFFLTGGSALAGYYLGHRTSKDLDLFTPPPADLDLAQAGGALLVVSQFTLLASTDRGRRPSFERAAAPAAAEPLIGRLVERLRAAGLQVESGRFGAHMRVALVNDGPVTLVLDFPAAR